MKKQELLKLADIAGREIVDLSGNRWTQDHEVHVRCVIFSNAGNIWHPHEDLNQAFECFRAVNKDKKYSFEIMYNDDSVPEDIECLLTPDEFDDQKSYMESIILTEAKTEAEAICKAVLRVEKTLNQSTQREKG